MSGDTNCTGALPDRGRPSAALVAVLLAFGLVAVACSGGAESVAETSETTAVPDAPLTGEVVEETSAAAETLLDEASPVEDARPGQLVWIHDQEPPDLHVDDPDNRTDVAAWIRQGLLEGLFGVDADLGYYLELLAEEPKITINNSGTVVIDYRLRPDLTWSDGTKLTADDVAYTHAILVEGCETEADRSVVDNSTEGCQYAMGPRVGYDLVTSFEVTGDSSFTIRLASFFPGWRSMYSQVFAKHAFGEDAFTVNRNLRSWSTGLATLPSSGPLVFDRWTEGRSIELGRNDAYHGSTSPDATSTGPATIDGVLVAFVPDARERVEFLLEGRAHVIMAAADEVYRPLAADDGFTVAASPGPLYEHWGLNLLNPHLAKPEVREAVAYALDKGEIVSIVYEPLFGPALHPEGLGNAYWMPSQVGYEDHQARYEGNNVDNAAGRLAAAGYEQGDDGVWEHPVDGRLQLRAGTTGGNPLREAQLELGREQLGRAGIEVVIDNEPGGLFFSRGPFSPEALQASASGGDSGDPDRWDIAQFSWVTGPWPGRVSGSYRSGSSTNPYGFNNPEFDVAATECDGVVDEGARTACYNRLDRFVTTLDEETDGLFVIPLTQRPSFYGYSRSVAAVGAAPDVVEGGPLVNIVDARLAE
ncbi:MAG: ABC transporter substrate-binding protein [Actinomycetota bacterium]